MFVHTVVTAFFHCLLCCLLARTELSSTMLLSKESTVIYVVALLERTVINNERNRAVIYDGRHPRGFSSEADFGKFGFAWKNSLSDLAAKASFVFVVDGCQSNTGFGEAYP